MNNLIKYLFVLLILSTITSCKNQSNINNKSKNDAISYACGFSIDESDKNYIKLTIFNPWNDYKTHSIYYLTKNIQTITPQDGIKIEIPVKKVMVNSATYLGFIELLDELKSVTAICNTKYIYNKEILKGVKDGIIEDLGDSFQLDMERLILSKPDVIFTSAYNGDATEADNFKRYKLTPIFNMEWMEPSLLARAEWIKVIGAFYNKLDLAFEVFNEIENNYKHAKQIALMAKSTPTILSGRDFNGTWSMPSGNSYNAELFKAAKGSYLYQNDTKYKGSIPVTIEEALIYFYDADIWINAQATSLEELAKTNDKYKLFKAFKTKSVYSNDKRANSHGGNDYWEMGVAKPDLVLKDLVKVLHPDLLPDYELTFMNKLD